MTFTHCQEILTKMLTAISIDNHCEIGNVNYTLRGIEAFFTYQGTEYHIELTTRKGE